MGIAVATIIAIILGIAAVVVYFKGARADKPWGTPLLVLLVIGAVVAVFAERLDIGSSIGRRRRRFQSARLLGKGLKGKIDDGAKVLIFRYPVATETMPEEEMPPPPEGVDVPEMPTVEEQVAEMMKNWKDAIEDGAGVSIEIVGAEIPAVPEHMMMMGPEYPGDARAFNAVLEKYKDEGIDAWISFVGVPRTMQGRWDLHNVASQKWSPRPLIGAELGVYYEPGMVRRWINDGLLDAAAIHPSTKSPDMEVVTKDNLDVLPNEAPVQMAPPPGPVEGR
jgi:hypothetical protein